jgi:hypothetical protein
MNYLLKILHYGNSVPTNPEQIMRWQASGGDELRKNKLTTTRDHLECNGRQHKAGYHRAYRGRREQAEEQEDDAERTLGQARHEPAKSEALQWCLMENVL